MSRFFLILFLIFTSCNINNDKFSNFSDFKSFEEESSIFSEYGEVKWELKYIVAHCTGSLGTHEPEFYEEIWKNIGWKNVGYSYLVLKDGTIWVWKSHKFDAYIEPFEVTNGVWGLNKHCVHIAYEGGVDKDLKPTDNMTNKQFKSFEWLIKRHLEFAPNAKIVGHKDIQINTNKACPSFDVREKFKHLMCTN